MLEVMKIKGSKYRMGVKGKRKDHRTSVIDMGGKEEAEKEHMRGERGRGNLTEVRMGVKR